MGKRTVFIELTDDQVMYIKKVLSSKKTPKTILTRCRILLDLDDKHGKQYSCQQVANRNGVTIKTLYTLVHNFLDNGLETVLTLKRGEGSNHSTQKVGGREEAKLLEVACGPVPEGHARWTVRLLADASKVVLEEPVSKSTVARVLKKTKSGPTKTTIGASPRKKTRNS
jgi:transposase